MGGAAHAAINRQGGSEMTLSRSASIEVRDDRVVAYRNLYGDVTCARCNGGPKATGLKPLRARSDAARLPACCGECGRGLRFLD